MEILLPGQTTDGEMILWVKYLMIENSGQIARHGADSGPYNRQAGHVVMRSL